MYDEFERAVTGKPERRMSVLGWVAVVFGLMVVLGVVGVGFAIRSAVDRVEEFASGIRAAPALAVADMVGRLQAHTDLLTLDPGQGLAFLEELDAGDPSEAYVERLVERILSDPPTAQAGEARVQSDPAEGTLTIHSDEGEVRMAFQKGEDGGSLVIDSEDGQVRFDLARTERGGYLTIDSEDGQVRFDLARTDEGGYLTMDSGDEQVRLDLIRGDRGGQLVLRTDDETLRFALGEDAEAAPAWVPRVDGMPDAPRQVYSLTADEGFLGAVSWETGLTAEALLQDYRDRLEGQGYDLRASHQMKGEASQGSLWATNEDQGRMVFLVAHQDEGSTRVLLGYGAEER